ncbi:MAG TPA: hypothetical protein VE057_18630 [Archangium sp.]|nr:hypothetical protein [Archangium sp.]
MRLRMERPTDTSEVAPVPKSPMAAKRTRPEPGGVAVVKRRGCVVAPQASTA